jgi:hypothetical protein
VGFAVGAVVHAHHAFHHAQALVLRACNRVHMHIAFNQCIRLHGQSRIPQRARAQQRLCSGCTRPGCINLPVIPGVGPPEAGVAQRQGQLRAALIIQRDLGRQVVQMGAQFGVKLGFHMLAKQVTQTPARNQNRAHHPEQGTCQQADTQRRAPGGSCHAQRFRNRHSGGSPDRAR